MSFIELSELTEQQREEATRIGIMRYIVTPTDVYGVQYSPMWGARLVRTINPKGTELPQSSLGSLQLIDPFPKIPAPLWQRWVKLCFHFCDGSRQDRGGIDHNSEVSCRFSRSFADPLVWKCWIPKQEVGGGSVHANMSELVNIETGERINVWPPEGEFDAGSSHSHNTMAAFFSSTDDSSELSSPGFHAVVGNIDRKAKRYEVTASIVLSKKRYIIEPPDHVVDLTSTPEMVDLTFHPEVLTVVKKYEYKSQSSVSRSYPGAGGYDNWGGMGYQSKPETPTKELGPSRDWSKSRDESSPRKGVIALSPNEQLRKGQIEAACARLGLIMDRLLMDKEGAYALAELLLKKYKLEIPDIDEPPTEKKPEEAPQPVSSD
jgi:hypothetical protein